MSTASPAQQTMSETVTLEIVDAVAVIEIANPPVNGLGDTTRKGLSDALAQAFADDAVTSVAITGAGRGFSGGADVRQFNTPAATAEPGLRTIFAQITAAEKPVVAAIHGFALGGGLELALACHYRIAQEGASIGLSEVNLGLIPGGGGTQRLPRLIGANKALQLIRKGASLDATKAKDLGVVDAVFTGDPAEAARTFLAEKTSSTQDHPVLDELPTAAADGADFEAARAEAKKNRRNGRAELAAIDAVEKSLSLPIEAGLDAERALFADLIDGPESKALRYLFFAERMTPKLASVPKDTPIRDIKTAGVIGSGTMGVGIAISLANAGIAVTLIDKSAEALDKATERIAGIYESSAKKGRLTAAEAEENKNRIVTATDYSSLNDVDLIIEAVFEDLDVKQSVFKEISQIARPDTILATNTSRLDVNKIADVTTKPENVIGLHFFSPAHVMRLLEVVQADRTSDEVLVSSMKLGQRIGKQPVLSQVCDGFIGNRMLSPYRRETDLLLEAGATPQQVDAALTDFGMAMGPFAVSDLAGLDIGEAGRETFRQTADPVLLESDSEISTILVEAGRYGQKTGAGYYRYEEGNRTPQPDPYVDEVIEQAAAKKGVQRREVSDEEIVERSMLALINEGAKLLDEGIAQRASDIDVVWTSGYGFPAYRGGPMYYATTLGLEHVVSKMREFQQNIGEYWKPADLLERLVKAGKKDFSDLDV
ncbi:3-hydroxyacyl-CoA dehydrogenase NAD-binding domain-containing protein [Enteractinococcus fodinae]|uniref:3-hydroxyacyl-CoA dehydrogenase n=1 Tax=Enteractinococcus fodinae TaxID=684663 RepID=A0ABU2B3X6_9MICC|nr:3-hydroxyacyl-CoA dehydrogenase NAD-binding domain-containing protein [Enteractinococcus fodinae]MDR7348305.1 3-hydroxyacyl-CoA dehydrogenase [Enteractinococcus fodinae]